ncbi:site-specific DNA-methyltransferase [Flammeovirga sp. EKP202]|uniref:site-specific DNA-methyltransferase n=1 Tax=Flammeovirga sp. EKP202 TaxID=2770592 RepID=UPI00165F75EE|nr:site-specific DNA-methyltransferase [Flammeovirga sp. EKP202]MBD0403679.1 site-specific DNA-methyltransferase [Flammeovirga sp. EKP202]
MKSKEPKEFVSSLNIIRDNIEKLSKVFPDTVKDGAVDVTSLLHHLGLTNDHDEEEFYNFTWKGKKEAIQSTQEPSEGTLRKVKNYGDKTTKNLFIEGDNFEVIKILQKSYQEKIKLIYIDPPYNTGKDFVYKDNYKDNIKNYLETTTQKDKKSKLSSANIDTTGRFHTNWLNMMYPRLSISRNLLKADGVIAIHIDEHEYANLEKIMNELYGENNRLGTIVWDKRNPKGDSKGIAYQHESILLYCKDIHEFKKKNAFKRVKENAGKIIAKANELVKTKGLSMARKELKAWMRKQDFSGGEKAYQLIDEKGKVYRPVSMAWPNKKQAPDDYFIPLVHPVTKKACPIPARGWRNPPATMERLLKDDLILFGADETTQPNRKYLLEENMFENVSSMIYYGGSDDAKLKELDVSFDTPKVVDVCKKIIEPICQPHDIVLDFFAGSATTAHAVLELNQGNQKQLNFIMVQIPEPIAKKHEAYKKGYQLISDVGIDRVNKVQQKIRKEDPENADKMDLGFTVFKISSSNIKSWSQNEDDSISITPQNLNEHCTEEDIIYEILLQRGLDLTLPIKEETIKGKKVFNVGDGLLYINSMNS